MSTAAFIERSILHYRFQLGIQALLRNDHPHAFATLARLEGAFSMIICASSLSLNADSGGEKLKTRQAIR